jgi:hypothetical protein
MPPLIPDTLLDYMTDLGIPALQSHLQTVPLLMKSQQEMDPVLVQNCLDFVDLALARRLERERKETPLSQVQKLALLELRPDRCSSPEKIQASLGHHQEMREGYMRQPHLQLIEI